MVAALWPVMKVAEVTSESQTRVSSVNIGVETFYSIKITVTFIPNTTVRLYTILKKFC